ncbi:MAG: alpha/beta hydrolase, partial [Eubacteriales bacterium]|nr:alpha/beta hydrolase [Eubacteriales bacterium]
MTVFLIIILLLVLVALALLFSLANTVVENDVRRRKNKQPTLFEPREYDHFWEEIDSQYYKQAYSWVKEQKRQLVTITSEDGLKLNAHFYKKEGAVNTAILVPGWKDIKEKFFAPLKMFYELNFNVLLIDQRAQGTSEGEYNTFGVKESGDVLRWVDYLKQNNLAENIVLWGISMGAATVML